MGKLSAPSTTTSQPSLEDAVDVVRRQPLAVADDLDVGVQPAQAPGRRLDLRLAEVGRRVEHLALEVRLVDDVVVHDAEPPDSGRCQVERRGRAQPSGTDEQHLRVEQALLALHADLGDEQVAAVAHLLALVEPRRKLERQPGLSPGVDAAGERDDCAVAPLAQRLGRAQRAVAVCAIEDDRALPVGLELLVELLHRNVHRVGDPTPLQLPQLADVDEDGRVVRGEQLVRPAGVDLEDNLTVTRSCSKDNRGRMSPRTRVFVVVGAAAAAGRRRHRRPGRGHGRRQGRCRAAAAGAATAPRRAAARPRPRRPRRPGGSRAATRGAPLLPAEALVARSGAQRPGGSSRATGRRKPESARRSRPGRTRAWRRSSSLARERRA